MILLNWKLGLLSGHARLLMPLTKQAKKEVIVHDGVIWSTMGKYGLLFQNEGKEEYVWIPWGVS